MEDQKRAAAQAAVAEIADGMLVGLGTGSTAAYAIAALARNVADGLNVRAVATSSRTAELARQVGIPVVDFSEVSAVDLCIDGVDEIDPALRAIKGAGGAMLREKIVATAAKRMIAIADGSKAAAQLGQRPVPVEILSFARAFVEDRIRRLGGSPTLRRTDRGDTYLTDQRNPVLDCAFEILPDLEGLDAALSGCPGVLGHGLFLSEIDVLYLGTAEGVARRDRKVSGQG